MVMMMSSTPVEAGLIRTLAQRHTGGVICEGAESVSIHPVPRRLLLAAVVLVAPTLWQAEGATKPFRIGLLQTEPSKGYCRKACASWDTSKAATSSTRLDI